MFDVTDDAQIKQHTLSISSHSHTHKTYIDMYISQQFEGISKKMGNDQAKRICFVISFLFLFFFHIL